MCRGEYDAYCSVFVSVCTFYYVKCWWRWETEVVRFWCAFSAGRPTRSDLGILVAKPQDTLGIFDICPVSLTCYMMWTSAVFYIIMQFTPSLEVGSNIFSDSCHVAVSDRLLTHRVGRHRQVWFILFVDKHVGVYVKLWNASAMCAILEHFCSEVLPVRGAISSVGPLPIYLLICFRQLGWYTIQ